MSNKKQKITIFPNRRGSDRPSTAPIKPEMKGRKGVKHQKQSNP